MGWGITGDRHVSDQKTEFVMAEQKMNDEWKPKCPRCRGMNFVTVMDRYMNTDKPIALVLCSAEECQTVVGALPYDAVWGE